MVIGQPVKTKDSKFREVHKWHSLDIQTECFRHKYKTLIKCCVTLTANDLTSMNSECDETAKFFIINT